MFNLLPSDRKKVVMREYYLRLSALILSMLSLTGIVSLVFLAPSFFAVRAKKSDAQDQLKILEQQTPELKEKENLESVVHEIMRKIEVLEPEDTFLPSQVIQRIVNNQPSGISVSAISYEISDNNFSVKVTGRGDNREALTIFTRSLHEDEIFDSVELPISDLAKDRDIDFSITLVVDFEDA